MNPEDEKKEKNNPEITPASTEGAEDEIKLSKEEFEALKERAEQGAKAQEGLANVVEEIKELRRKNQELSGQKATEEPVVPAASETAEEIARRIIAEERAKDAQASRESIIKDFLKSHSEFNEENDKVGLKRDAFVAKLGRYNLGGIDNEELKSVLEDTYSLITGVKSNESNLNGTYAGSHKSPAPVKTDTNAVNGLSKAEAKFVRDVMNGDTEGFLKKKESHPELVRGWVARHTGFANDDE